MIMIYCDSPRAKVYFSLYIPYKVREVTRIEPSHDTGNH